MALPIAISSRLWRSPSFWEAAPFLPGLAPGFTARAPRGTGGMLSSSSVSSASFSTVTSIPSGVSGCASLGLVRRFATQICGIAHYSRARCGNEPKRPYYAILGVVAGWKTRRAWRSERLRGSLGAVVLGFVSSPAVVAGPAASGGRQRRDCGDGRKRGDGRRRERGRHGRRERGRHRRRDLGRRDLGRPRRRDRAGRCEAQHEPELRGLLRRRHVRAMSRAAHGRRVRCRDVHGDLRRRPLNGGRSEPAPRQHRGSRRQFRD